jgi:1-deoxy-D-xylulose-5-phosphate synthase
VGIAEEHAVLFAAGLATKGMRPVCAIYSTFLQRAYDQIIHDVALQNLPVTFCMDRAGLSPNDGPTHHGLFDIAYLRCVPECHGDAAQGRGRAGRHAPHGPRARLARVHPLPEGRRARAPRSRTGRPARDRHAEVLREGSNIVLWALGPDGPRRAGHRGQAAAEEGLSVGVVNARFIRPLDRDAPAQPGGVVPLIVTLEDHVLTGGFGSSVLEALQEAGCPAAVERIGWPDRFVEHGSSVEALRAAHGLSPDDMHRKVLDRWRT